MDKQSFLWARRLLIIGGLLSLSTITIEHKQYHLKDFGVVLVCFGLLFFIGFEANRKFNLMIVFLISTWATKILLIIATHIGVLDSFPYALNLFYVILGVLLMFSPAIFCLALFELSKHHHLRYSPVSWRNSTILNFILFAIPGAIYLFSSIGQLIGLSGTVTSSYLFLNYHSKDLTGVSTLLLWAVEAIFILIPFVNLYLSFETIIKELFPSAV